MLVRFNQELIPKVLLDIEATSERVVRSTCSSSKAYHELVHCKYG